MRTTTRLLLLSSVVLGGGAIVLAARPRPDPVARSFRTSSSSGPVIYALFADAFMGGCYDAVAADRGEALGGVRAPAILEIGTGPGHLAERLPAGVTGGASARRVPGDPPGPAAGAAWRSPSTCRTRGVISRRVTPDLRPQRTPSARAGAAESGAPGASR